MKRNSYEILINGKHVATKYAWNAARRQLMVEVRKHVHEIGGEYILSFESYIKGQDKNHEFAEINYVSTTGGNKINCNIRKIKP